MYFIQEFPTIAQGIPELVVHSRCGVPFLGDLQKPSRHDPGQPALAGRLDQMTARGPFHPQPVCDSYSQRTMHHLQQH